MKVYKVIELDYCGNEYECYGTYSTFEKAQAIIDMFDGYEDYGACGQNEFEIVVIEIDETPDWVFDLLDGCKKCKKECEEGS